MKANKNLTKIPWRVKLVDDATLKQMCPFDEVFIC